jgi:hypothetical protein
VVFSGTLAFARFGRISGAVVWAISISVALVEPIAGAMIFPIDRGVVHVMTAVFDVATVSSAALDVIVTSATIAAGLFGVLFPFLSLSSLAA